MHLTQSFLLLTPDLCAACSNIGERPNLRPVGIGNNDDEMDLSLLLQSDGNDRPSSLEEFPAHLGFGDDDTDAMHAGADGADVDDSDSDSERPAKRMKLPRLIRLLSRRRSPNLPSPLPQSSLRRRNLRSQLQPRTSSPLLSWLRRRRSRCDFVSRKSRPKQRHRLR
jgi:hypothetical protein